MSAAAWSWELVPLTSCMPWHYPPSYNLLFTAKIFQLICRHAGNSAEYKHTSGDILYPTVMTLQF